MGREKIMADWVRRCFGDEAMSPHERACRVLEEAIELAQAEGVSKEIVAKSVDYVYNHPAGDPQQEGGGVACTLLAWCACHGFTFEGVADAELARVTVKPPEHFRKRQQRKADAGMSMQLNSPPMAAGEG